MDPAHLHINYFYFVNLFVKLIIYITINSTSSSSTGRSSNEDYSYQRSKDVVTFASTFSWWSLWANDTRKRNNWNTRHLKVLNIFILYAEGESIPGYPRWPLSPGNPGGLKSKLKYIYSTLIAYPASPGDPGRPAGHLYEVGRFSFWPGPVAPTQQPERYGREIINTP